MDLVDQCKALRLKLGCVNLHLTSYVTRHDLQVKIKVTLRALARTLSVHRLTFIVRRSPLASHLSPLGDWD
jgi:hypothetical protein